MAREKKDIKMVQVRISMPEEYRRLFKAYCAKQDSDMSKVITDLIEDLLIKEGEIERDDIVE